MRLTFQLLLLICICCTLPSQLFSQQPGVNGFTVWQTGHDAKTRQIIPAAGESALTQLKDAPVVHVKFIVSEYGELWFPLANTPPNVESAGVDLSGSTSITI